MPETNGGLSWDTILAEEPFTGQHWQGVYGLPAGAVIKTWDDNGSDSEFTPPLSPASHHQFPLQDEERLFESDDIQDTWESVSKSEDGVDLDDSIERSLQLRFQLEALEKRQYWRQNWQTDANTSNPFDISDPSTLGTL